MPYFPPVYSSTAYTEFSSPNQSAYTNFSRAQYEYFMSMKIITDCPKPKKKKKFINAVPEGKAIKRRLP